MADEIRPARPAGAVGRPLPMLAIVTATMPPAPWEQQIIDRLQTSGLCIANVWRDGRDGRFASPSAAGGAILHLSGRPDPGLPGDAEYGLWRLCDERGVVLGDWLHGREGIAAGTGARLHLISINGAGATLIEIASAYAEPGEPVSMVRLCEFAQTLLLAALREIVVLGTLEPRPAWTARGTSPTYVQCALWKLRGRINHASRRLRRIFLVEQWMLGIVDMPLGKVLRMDHPPVRWIGKRVRSHYLADPFGVPGSSDELYCEEFDNKTNLGRIVKLKLDRTGQPGSPQPVALGLPGHMSYPCLFEFDGKLYCVAESAQSGRCVLNRLSDDGLWTYVTELLSGVAAADPTLFRHDERFWLAYTDVARGRFDNLCLSYASDLHGPWHAHPQNPVKIDHRSSRPGGSVVVDDEQLFRIAQDCTSAYGQAATVNRIRHCTPELYREDAVRTISPKGDRMNPHGLHTMSAWGARTLVDGKRYGINWSVVVRKVMARVTGTRRTSALLEVRVNDES